MSLLLLGSGRRGGASVQVRRPLVAFLGDSHMENGIAYDADECRYRNISLAFWTIFYGNGNYRTDATINDPGLNFGVSGETSGEILARVGDAIASDADVVCVVAGTNDLAGTISSTTPYTTWEANVTATWDALLAAGKIVIAVPPPPNGNYSDANKRATYWRMVRFVQMAQFSGRRNFYVADYITDYVNPTSASGAPRTGYSTDTTHAGSYGGDIIGRCLARILNALYPLQIRSLSCVADDYDATYNPTGNLVTNGILDGTSGSKSAQQGVTPSGSLATSWVSSFSDGTGTGTPFSGLTAVWAKGEWADGRPMQTLTLTGAYDGTVNTLFGMVQQPSNYSEYIVGTDVQAEADVALVATGGAEPITGIRLRYSVTMDGTAYIASCGDSNTTDMLRPDGFTGRLITPRIPIIATPTAVSISLYAMMKSGTAVAVNSELRFCGIRAGQV